MVHRQGVAKANVQIWNAFQEAAMLSKIIALAPEPGRIRAHLAVKKNKTSSGQNDQISL
jgi:hypothetical protein